MNTRKIAKPNRFAYLENRPPICQFCDYPFLQNLDGTYEHWGETLTPKQVEQRAYFFKPSPSYTEAPELSVDEPST